MADAGNKHGVEEVRRNRVALAGDQRRRDRADIAGEHRADAAVDRIAHAFDEGRGAQPPAGLGGRRDDPHRAVDEPGGADALEIKVASEIVASRPQRRQRRIELRLRLDKSAGRWRRAAAHGEAHALRLVDDAVAFDALEPEHEAIGFLTLVTQFDEARNGNTVSRKAQNRMFDQGGLQRCDRKPERDGKEAERQHEGDRAPAHPDRGGRGQSGCRQRRPRGRFVIGCEVENDAGAEGDREPGKQPAGADLGRGPDAHARRHGKAELRPDAVPAPLHTARRPRSDTGTRGSACTGLCRP